MVKGGNTNLLMFRLLNGWVHQLKSVVKCAVVQGLYKSISKSKDWRLTDKMV